MGDARYQPHYDRIVHAEDPAASLREMRIEDLVQALAAASRAADPFVANILATEALNRIRRARLAIHHLGEGLCLMDPEGRLVLFNPAAERMTGWRCEEVEGRPVQETFLPSEVWKRALASPEAVHSEEERFRRKDGSSFPAACTLAPALGAGIVQGVVIVFRDVTEERRAEAQRRAWLEVTQAAYKAHDMMGEGLLLLVARRVAHANETFQRMSGYALEELRGLPDATAIVPPEDRADLADRIRRCEAGETSHEREQMRLLCKNGARVPVEVAAVPTRAEEPPAEVVCIVRRRRGKDRDGGGLSGGRRGPRGP